MIFAVESSHSHLQHKEKTLRSLMVVRLFKQYPDRILIVAAVVTE